MATPPGRRDDHLIDALDSQPRQSFAGTIWRVVHESREPTQCSRPGGRWDDGTFEVLYTSLERNGAIAEMNFHLARGQPVFPSKIRFALHELRISLDDVLILNTVDELASLGLDKARFGQLSYDTRTAEYPTSQQIAETAHFLGFKAMIVPNARWACTNLIAFCGAINAGDIERINNHGTIDWLSWRKKFAGN